MKPHPYQPRSRCCAADASLRIDDGHTVVLLCSDCGQIVLQACIETTGEHDCDEQLDARTDINQESLVLVCQPCEEAVLHANVSGGEAHLRYRGRLSGPLCEAVSGPSDQRTNEADTL